jgi:hypothetical protein
MKSSTKIRRELAREKKARIPRRKGGGSESTQVKVSFILYGIGWTILELQICEGSSPDWSAEAPLMTLMECRRHESVKELKLAGEYMDQG